MRLSTGLLAAGLPMIVAGFRNASPYLLISSEEFPASTSPFSSAVGTASDFISTASSILSKCNSDVYILVSQPNLSSTDLRNPHSAPHLRSQMTQKAAHTLSLEFVKEEPDKNVVNELERFVTKTCEAETIRVDASSEFEMLPWIGWGEANGNRIQAGNFPTFDNMKPKVVRVDFPALPEGDLGAGERLAVLKEHDAFLYSILTLLPDRHTVIYTSTPYAPSSKPTLLNQATRAVQQVKRSLTARKADSSDTAADNIFGKYQFFTDGILMGYVGVFFLLVILLGALNSITSLQISYAAFDKENGPNASKKQQ